MIAWIIGGYAFIGVVLAVTLLELAPKSVNCPPDLRSPVKAVIGVAWPLVVAAMAIAALYFAVTDIWGWIRRRRP